MIADDVEQIAPPTIEELHARLVAFESRTLDLERVLVALILRARFDSKDQDAFSRIRRGLDGV